MEFAETWLAVIKRILDPQRSRLRGIPVRIRAVALLEAAKREEAGP